MTVPARMRPLPAAALDVVAVLAFVVAGLRTHSTVDLPGTAATAWPFLVALAAGWLVTRAWRAPAALLPTGVGVWLVTLGAGMLLRRLAGDGTAWAFVVVAAVTLAVLLIGWRLVAAALRRR